MLKNSLYTVLKLSGDNNAIEAIVELDEHHEIFKGHFPGQPVLPGVCLLQMTKELTETFFQQAMKLRKADDIRFLAMVDPGQNKQLTFAIGYERVESRSIKVNAKITKKDDAVCCKIKALFELPS